jgi:GNAT superfamily N-acetyltransferase
MDFVDKALARRLEAGEEMPQVHYGMLYQKLRPEIGTAVEPICGGHMIFAGVGSPVGRTTGMGFDGSATAADLDRMESFYRSHGAPAQIDVCPLTDPPLLEMLKERGYTMGELNNVLFRRLSPDEDYARRVDAQIRAGRAEEADAFSAIVQRAFYPQGNAPVDFSAMLAPLFQFEGAIAFVAEIDGQAVACGAGLIVPERGIVALFGAGTLAEFRGRGLQTALILRRMEAAAKAGCEYAVVVTQGGSPSQRNAERLGFRVAYSKATLVKGTG